MTRPWLGRRGFVLIAVLWVIVALGSLVGLSLGLMRLGHQATVNRILLARDRWGAEACLAIAQIRWAEHRLADTATVDLGHGKRCAWRVTDPTARLNVNTADRETLERLLVVVGARGSAIDSFVTALIAARHHVPLPDVATLASLPGFQRRWTPLLTTDGPGSINAASAAAPVLAALPGLTPEAVERLMARRALVRPIGSLDELAGTLSPAARAALLERYGDLARLVTFTPPELVLAADGWVGGQGGPDALHATIELLVVPLSNRLAVVRRRMS